MNNKGPWNPESTAGIIEHMNEDHAEAVDLYLKAFGNISAETSEVKMTAINENGIKLSYESLGNTQSCDILFADAGVNSPLTQLSDARSALVALVGNARKKLEVQ